MRLALVNLWAGESLLKVFHVGGLCRQFSAGESPTVFAGGHRKISSMSSSLSSQIRLASLRILGVEQSRRAVFASATLKASAPVSRVARVFFLG